MRQSEQAVERLVKVPLTQGQFDALADFCFNLGAGRLASSTLLKDAERRRYEAAREQLLRWDHGRGRGEPGLKARREAEFQLWDGSAGQDRGLRSGRRRRAERISALRAAPRA